MAPSIVLNVWAGHAGRHAVRFVGDSKVNVVAPDLLPFAGPAISAVAIIAVARGTRGARTDDGGRTGQIGQGGSLLYSPYRIRTTPKPAPREFGYEPRRRFT